MYPSINIRTYTYTRYTHKLFVHYTVTSLFSLRNQRREKPSSSIYVLFFQTCISSFFFHQQYIHLPSILLHLPSKKKNKKKDFIYIWMITMMIYMFYTLLSLEKFNNEMHSSMPTIGEIDAGGENEEKDRENKE